jgi:hypothetical protein
MGATLGLKLNKNLLIFRGSFRAAKFLTRMKQMAAAGFYKLQLYAGMNGKKFFWHLVF